MRQGTYAGAVVVGEHGGGLHGLQTRGKKGRGQDTGGSVSAIVSTSSGTTTHKLSPSPPPATLIIAAMQLAQPASPSADCSFAR